MKNTFLVLLLLSFCYSNAQKNKGNILYDFHHQTDSLDKNSVKTEKYRLIFNKVICLYRSIKNEEYDSLRPALMKQMDIEFQKTGKLNYKMPPIGNPYKFYTDLNTQKTFIKMKLNEIDYLVEEHDIINWKILDESKTILDKICQKATCYFKGRNYTAWFTNEIPVSVGPSKFNGLPGAILEIIDSKNEFSFIAYRYLTSSYTAISIPSDIEKISKKEFAAVKKALKDNPRNNNSGIQMTATTNKFIKNGTPQPVNPMELKD